MTGSRDYTVAVYYFPGYHPDPRNDRVHGAGWTEWELVRQARPRFPGHIQPLVPAWGYENEADPAAFARKIDAAADHAIDSFIFDWYWYDDGPFLSGALEQGYLKAHNNDRLRFALMWANHNWVDIHPARLGVEPALLYPGAVSRATFDALAGYVIQTYFTHPSYWKIDGAPYFSIYELYRLIEGLGGLDATREALASFRARTQAAGLGDLHLNAVVWGVKLLPGETTIERPGELLAALGFDSVTSYVWIHHLRLSEFPETSYSAVAEAAAAQWPEIAAQFDLPYFPNVTAGWDASPRTRQADPFDNRGYPFMPILGGNTPEAFRSALISVKQYLDSRGDLPKIVTINAWNEWTEGSYLEPDTVHGLARLVAIREVFGS
jgi:hypothetical protein